MAAYRFGIVVECSELRLADRTMEWRSRSPRIRARARSRRAAWRRGSRHASSQRPRASAAGRGWRNALAIGRLRGGRQRLELGRFAPVVQKILDRGAFSDRNLFRQFASAARRLDFRSSFVGKIGGLLKIEPRADRAAIFIVRGDGAVDRQSRVPWRKRHAMTADADAPLT